MNTRLTRLSSAVLLLLTSAWHGAAEGGYYALESPAFFALPAVRERIDLSKPDYELLDAALFHATNEARQKAGVAAVRFHPALHRAARQHAENMIRLDFYGHVNPFNPMEGTADKRIGQQSKAFRLMAENIGQYQVIDTPDLFYVRRAATGDQYEYLEMQTLQRCQPFSYAGYARYAVQAWTNSSSHRVNLLNPRYTHGACAGVLSRNPYGERRAPYGRLVQNFGSWEESVGESK